MFLAEERPLILRVKAVEGRILRSSTPLGGFAVPGSVACISALPAPWLFDWQHRRYWQKMEAAHRYEQPPSSAKKPGQPSHVSFPFYTVYNACSLRAYNIRKRRAILLLTRKANMLLSLLCSFSSCSPRGLLFVKILFINQSITFHGIRMQHRQKRHTLPNNFSSPQASNVFHSSGVRK